MAKERKIVLYPPVELEKREGDITLPSSEVLKISLFARMKKKLKLEEYPGTFALRRFRQGEVICRQGEAGWTAFYALTGEDVVALADPLLQVAEKEGTRATMEAEIERL